MENANTEADAIEQLIKEIQSDPAPEEIEATFTSTGGSRLEFIDGDLVEVYTATDGREVLTIIQRGVDSLEAAIDHLQDWLVTCEPDHPMRDVMIGRLEGLAWCLGEAPGDIVDSGDQSMLLN